MLHCTTLGVETVMVWPEYVAGKGFKETACPAGELYWMSQGAGMPKNPPVATTHLPTEIPYRHCSPPPTTTTLETPLLHQKSDVNQRLPYRPITSQALAEFHKQNSQSLKAVHQSQYMEAPVQPKKSHFKDVFTLMHRATKIMIRTPELLFGRWAFCTVVGALVATIFISPDSTWQGVTEISSFFLMAAALLNFTSSEVQLSAISSYPLTHKKMQFCPWSASWDRLQSIRGTCARLLFFFAKFFLQ